MPLYQKQTKCPPIGNFSTMKQHISLPFSRFIETEIKLFPIFHS